ncbi:MAG: hypothetical protein R2796_04375 [Chitinophagaceae bacterium]
MIFTSFMLRDYPKGAVSPKQEVTSGTWINGAYYLFQKEEIGIIYS